MKYVRASLMLAIVLLAPAYSIKGQTVRTRVAVLDFGSSVTGVRAANAIRDPFEFSTRAERVFIRGRENKEPSRQDLLIERYKPRAGR